MIFKFSDKYLHLQKLKLPMRQLIILLFIGLAITVSSCREDFVFEPSTGDLAFSRDTVYLDTVFTNIGSSTYTLKVYNKSSKDIKIPTIQLGKGLNSKYRMTVDGMIGENNRIFRDVELLAKDSMFIFIEVTSDVADANPTDFLYTDQIQFDSGDNFQKVELVTLIQDAYFIFPNRPIETGIKEKLSINGELTDIVGHQLSTPEELNWTNEKPYVVYGFAFVPNGSLLNIQAGARIHFHADSGIIIDKNGALNINGTINNDVVFEGDRLEPDFANTTGQWFGIANFSNNLNTIEHLIIKNASVGIYNIPYGTNFYETKLNIKNSQIYNCSNYGIFSLGGIIDGKNTVINNCGQACFAGVYGGSYNFTHCTFNNEWPSSRQYAVYCSDYLKDAEPPTNTITANFKNCIFYGSNSNELFLEQKGAIFNSIFQNCLTKINISSSSGIINNPLYNSIRLEQNGNKINLNPKFKDTDKNQLNLLEGSAAIGFGIFEPTVPEDIIGNVRTISNTDIGAYQFVP